MSDDANVRPPQEPVTRGVGGEALRLRRRDIACCAGWRGLGWCWLGWWRCWRWWRRWYTGTEDFQHRVGGEVVSMLENATGGRVELRHLSFDLWHLAIEADGLVIHGTEAAGEMPYLSASKIFLRRAHQHGPDAGAGDGAAVADTVAVPARGAAALSPDHGQERAQQRSRCRSIRVRATSRCRIRCWICRRARLSWWMGWRW